MQYTPHYNLNLPEGSDIVNPLVQDNPNYTAIDTALYNNKLCVVGSATHVKTGTNHAITLADSDINQFKFVATGDYVTGDTFTVDGVTVTPRIADGSSIPNGAFKINSTVLCILDGTILNFIGVGGVADADDVFFDNSGTDLLSTDVEDAIKEVNNKLAAGSVSATAVSGDTYAVFIRRLADQIDITKLKPTSKIKMGSSIYSFIADEGSQYVFAMAGYIYDKAIMTCMFVTPGTGGGLRSWNNQDGLTILTNNNVTPGTQLTLYY